MNATPIPSREELARKMAQGLADAAAAVQSATSGVDAPAAFAAYALSRLCGMNRDGIDKHTHPGPAAVEYAAWLLYPNFGSSGAREAGRIQAVIDTLEAYGTALTFVEIFPLLSDEEKDDRLAAHLRLHSGMVRGSAYPQQVMRRIERVLKPFEDHLAVLSGVGPWRAFEIASAVGRQIEDNVNGMRAAFREVHATGEALAKKGATLTEHEKMKLTALGEELHRIVGGMEGDWAPTWEQIEMRLPGVKRAEWDAVRCNIGFTPDSRAKMARMVDVQDRPLFFLDDNRALLVHVVEVFDAIFAHFDDLARGDLQKLAQVAREFTRP